MVKPKCSPLASSISPMSKSMSRLSRISLARAWGSAGEAKFMASRFAVPAGKGSRGMPVSAKRWAAVATVPSPPAATTASKSSASRRKSARSVQPLVQRMQISSPSRAKARTKS